MSKPHKGVYKQAKVRTEGDGTMDLVLPEFKDEDVEKLPPVSIVTITHNRGQFAAIMLYNWVNLKYPRDKLEWVILDDSDPNVEYDLRDYIPYDDPAIRYVKLDKWYPVAEKRNKAVEMAKYDIIVLVDDDDYYFPDHVLAKVRLMEHYKVDGVHSMPIGVYDLMEGTSILYSPHAKNGLDSAAISEASAAFKKDYWRRNKFHSTHEKGMGEGASLIGKNFHRWLNVHFLFNTISITHSKNVTGHNRRFINENMDQMKTGNFEDVFPEDFKLILANVKKMLVSNYQQPEKK